MLNICIKRLGVWIGNGSVVFTKLFFFFSFLQKKYLGKPSQIKKKSWILNSSVLGLVWFRYQRTETVGKKITEPKHAGTTRQSESVL